MEPSKADLIDSINDMLDSLSVAEALKILSKLNRADLLMLSVGIENALNDEAHYAKEDRAVDGKALDLVKKLKDTYSQYNIYSEEAAWFNDMDDAFQNLCQHLEMPFEPVNCPNRLAGIHCDCVWCSKSRKEI